MQVFAVLEGPRHAAVAGDVGRGPQLHRAVVAADEDEARRRLEQRPEVLVARRLLDIGLGARGAPAGRGGDAVAGMDAPGDRRHQLRQRRAEGGEHLVEARQRHQRQDRRIMRRLLQRAALRRELARFLGALPTAQLRARQYLLQQGALVGRFLRQARGQIRPAHVEAGDAVGVGRFVAPGRVSSQQRGVGLEIEPDAAMAQAHHGGGDADLDLIGARLRRRAPAGCAAARRKTMTASRAA